MTESKPQDGQAGEIKIPVVFRQWVQALCEKHYPTSAHEPEDWYFYRNVIRFATEAAYRHLSSSLGGPSMRWVLPPKNDDETYYTYFLIQFEDCGIPEYDYTIVDALSEVADQLQIAETSFDDDTLKAQAVVSGIALTDAEWVRWKDTFELPERFNTSSESSIPVQ